MTSILSGAHKPGPTITLENGHSETAGVRVMKLQDDLKVRYYVQHMLVVWRRKRVSKWAARGRACKS